MSGYYRPEDTGLYRKDTPATVRWILNNKWGIVTSRWVYTIAPTWQGGPARAGHRGRAGGGGRGRRARTELGVTLGFDGLGT